MVQRAHKQDTNHDDGEWGVWLDVTTIGRERKLDRRHIVDGGNITHRCGVTRAFLDLLSVCDGLADTEADEVVAEAMCH